MARREAKSALCKYQSVRFHKDCDTPTDQLRLVSQPWAYLESHLTQQLKNKRGKNRANLIRAIYFASLAESFTKASQTVDLPSSATLAYYGVLNLTKCLLSYEGKEIKDENTHHGLSLGGSNELKFSKLVGLDVYKSLCGLASNRNVTPNPAIEHVLGGIPEIHHLVRTEEIWKGKPRFLPVNIAYMTNPSHNKLWLRVSYESKQEQICNHGRFETNFGAQFLKPELVDGMTMFDSKRAAPLTSTTWKSAYSAVRGNLTKSVPLVSILTHQSYRHYVDLSDNSAPAPANTFAALFYFGALARYRPEEMHAWMSGKGRPVLNEALAVCPPQFLYMVLSRIVGKICVKPMSVL